jgi:6-phosphogluconolactonase
MAEADVSVVRLVAENESFDQILAESLCRRALECVDRGARFRLALSWDDPLLPAYEALASKAFRSRMPWGRTDLLFSDEVCVALDHPESRFGRARRTLLDRLGLPADQVHRMRGDESDVAAAARRYEAVLARVAQSGAATAPQIDLALLSLSPDGRLAGLRPGSAALVETVRFVVLTPAPRHGFRRLTLTPRALNSASAVWVAARGEACAGAVFDALEGEPEPESRPADAIRPMSGDMVWFVDAGAAHRLAVASKDVTARK